MRTESQGQGTGWKIINKKNQRCQCARWKWLQKGFSMAGTLKGLLVIKVENLLYHFNIASPNVTKNVCCSVEKAMSAFWLQNLEQNEKNPLFSSHWVIYLSFKRALNNIYIMKLAYIPYFVKFETLLPNCTIVSQSTFLKLLIFHHESREFFFNRTCCLQAIVSGLCICFSSVLGLLHFKFIMLNGNLVWQFKNFRQIASINV